ncbi:hypothetical protein D9M72_490500 [compost metagenome]
MPVGRGIGVVAAARAGEDQAVAGPGFRRPWARQALVTVNHEIDGQLARRFIHPADGVRPGVRPLLAWQGFPDGPKVEGERVLDAGLREGDLHVPVYVFVVHIAGEAFAAGHDPHHVRREFLAPEDREVRLGARFSAG